jgi:hypothetical protein
MGSLVVCLVVISSRVRAHAVRDANLRSESAGKVTSSDVEDQTWLAEQLAKSHNATLSDLATERARLASVEAHLRELRAEVEKLNHSTQSLDELKSQKHADLAELDDEIHTLAQLLAAANSNLAADKDAKQNLPPRFSIVPYVGPNQTRRRPVMIECTPRAVIIQPEGVEFGEDDFYGPQGPGNPLASAIRAAIEYYTQRALAAGEKEDPYPLLLVRPDGVVAYHIARGALNSWKDEFGYELIGADWKLDFPDGDFDLRQLELKAQQEGRIRQQRAIQAAPREYAARRRSPFEGGSGGPGTPGGRGNGPVGAGGIGGPSGGGGLGGGVAHGGGSGGAPGGAEGHAMGGNGDGTGSYPGGNGGSGTFFGGGGTESNSQGDSYFGGGGDGGNGPRGSATGQPGNGEPFASGAPGGSGTGRDGSLTNSGSPGGMPSLSNNESTQPEMKSPGPQAPDDPFSNGRKSAASGSPSSGGMASSRASNHPDSSESTRSGHRGSRHSGHAGFSFDENVPGESAISRPLAVKLRSDRLQLLGEDGLVTKDIPTGKGVAEATDELQAAVLDQMKHWGSPGKGSYWRPVLVVDFEPKLAPRYAEIQSHLAESGLTAREKTVAKTPSDKVRR